MHQLCFLYRLYDSKSASNLDIILPRYNILIFICVCFWHFHQCKSFKWPKTNSQF
ncbi:PDDEXK family nuclease [Acinetobacter faecalis]|uniref:hypothetical protein n=1 Tax=Acinetobacter faecalis TaxID=2665161 RepID=UPI00387E483B